jgi:integrase
LVALKTGMRQGELLALRWSDVDLEQAVIRVRSSYTGGSLGTPKNRERRDVDLISAVVELLPCLRDGGSNDDLVFPGENGHSFLSPTVVLRRGHVGARQLAGTSGMGRAGIEPAALGLKVPHRTPNVRHSFGQFGVVFVRRTFGIITPNKPLRAPNAWPAIG